eukprot:s3579_g3.t1
MLRTCDLCKPTRRQSNLKWKHLRAPLQHPLGKTGRHENVALARDTAVLVPESSKQILKRRLLQNQLATVLKCDSTCCLWACVGVGVCPANPFEHVVSLV